MPNATKHIIFILLAFSLNARADMSDWFVILDNTNGFYASPGVPEPAVAALTKAQHENEELKTFSFAPAGDWVLWDDDGFDASSEMVPGYQHLNGSRSATFGPTGSFLILYPGKGFWGPGSAAWVRVKELLNDGHAIRSVSLAPNDGFIVLYDHAGVSFGGVPAGLTNVLDHAVSNHVSIQCVAFSGRDWICLAANDWWAGDTNSPASKVVAQEFKLGQHPKWIAFVPNPGRFNPDKFGTTLRQGLAGKLAGGYACEVIDRGKVVVALADGWARAPWEPIAPSVKWTVNQPIEIASVSKTITATALLKLWQDSRSTSRQFSLDDPFWPFLKNICPNASDEVKQITIRQLLMHRSGFMKDPFHGHDRRDLKAVRQLLTMPLAHQPGTFFQYENINYSVIRFVIEQLSRENYTDYVKSHVLAPMGITDMETHNEYFQPMCYYGKPGVQQPGDCKHIDLSSTAGSYGWFASAADLAKFLDGLRSCRVLSPATRDVMFKDKLGWDSGNPWVKGGLDFWSHGLVRSVIYYFPDGLAVVFLTNCDIPVGSTLNTALKEARY